MQRQQRVNRELAKIARAPPTGICLWARDDSLQILEATLTGPENTPYDEGIFHLELTIPTNYPFSPPSIKFITKIYHPNIDESGRICLDLLKMPPVGSWRPTIGVEGLLIAIRTLLEFPNPHDPLSAGVAAEFLYSRSDYERQAKLYTTQYAKSNAL